LIRFHVRDFTTVLLPSVARAKLPADQTASAA
jgi:hypothetical protein